MSETASYAAPATGTDGDSGGIGAAPAILIVIATILSVVSIFAVWANRQVLTPVNWADTSSRLLENEAIRSQTAQFITDQIYSNVNVQEEIKKALPNQADILAGPAANALRGVAQDGINKALGTAPVQSLWKAANQTLAEQVVNVIDEKNTGFLQFSGNDVKLDLRPAVLNLASKFGLSTQAEKIPPGAAEVPVFSSKDIGSVRSAAKALSGAALILPLLSVLLYAAAVMVAAGRRRKVLIRIGWALIVGALVVLAARNIVGGIVVDSTVTTAAVKPAGQATWDIASSMLKDAAVNTIIVAIVFLLALMLAGPRKSAVAIRQWAAPWLKDKPAVAYGVVYAIVLLILIWGPIPATREWVAVLLFMALAGLGTWALARQTAAEFPDASAAEQTEALRAAWTSARASLAAGFSRGAKGARDAATQMRGKVGEVASRPGAAGRTEPQEGSEAATEVNAPADQVATQPLPAAEESRIAALERLVKLKDTGALTEDEFAAEKQRVLGGA